MACAARTFAVGGGNRGGTQAVAMVAITQFNWGKTFRPTRSKLDNQNRPRAQSKLLSTQPTCRANQATTSASGALANENRIQGLGATKLSAWEPGSRWWQTR